MNKATNLLVPALLLAGLTCSINALSANTVTYVSNANTITTCKTRPAGLESFMMEHPVDVSTILSTLVPGGLPADVSDAIFSGAKEVRSRITYNKTTKILDNHLFLVDPGSALPSPSDIDFAAVRFAWISVQVEKLYSTCQPVASIMLTGKTVSGFPIYAPPAGAPYAFSFSYSMDEQPVFKDIVSLSAGMALLYHDTAPGTITWIKKGQ